MENSIAFLLIFITNVNGYILNNTIADRYISDFGGDQRLECFASSNCWGASFKIDYGITDFWKYGWDNKFSSCRFNGFWFLYQDVNYNRNYPAVIIKNNYLPNNATFYFKKVGCSHSTFGSCVTNAVESSVN